MKSSRISICAIAGLILLIAATANTVVPLKISYQGRVTNPAGDPVPDGQYNLVFTLWNHETSSDNAYRRWSSGTQPIDVEDGLCQYLLGSDGSLSHSVFTQYPTLYLGIAVMGDPEMTPRAQLVTVPYAFTALEADSADVSSVAHSVSSGAVDSDALATNAVNTIDINSSAVTASRTLDEPGIANNYITSAVTIATSGVTNIVSESINAPAAGYIVAMAQITLRITGASHGNVLIDILTNATSSPGSTNYGLFGSWNEPLVSSDTRNGTVAIHRIYSVGSQGNYTYYVNATRGYTDGTAVASNAKLTLMYFPTSYD